MNLKPILNIFLFFLCLLLAATVVVRLLRPMPFSATLPLGLSLLLGFENLVLSFLSLFEGVNASILFTINLAALLGLYFWVRQKGLKPWRIIALKQIPLLFWLLLPMGVVLLFLALLYPPNNYDSMTYHMARVAHWIQNQSIGHYPTSLKQFPVGSHPNLTNELSAKFPEQPRDR